MFFLRASLFPVCFMCLDLMTAVSRVNACVVQTISVVSYRQSISTQSSSRNKFRSSNIICRTYLYFRQTGSSIKVENSIDYFHIVCHSSTDIIVVGVSYDYRTKTNFKSLIFLILKF